MVEIKLMKLFYKTIIISGVTVFSVLLLIILLFVLYLTYRIPLNNYHLMIFKDDFNKFVDQLHPQQSAYIAEVTETGNLGGASNHCDFLVGEFRSSPLSKEMLKNNYFRDSLSSGVYFIDDDIFTESPWSEWKEKYLKDYKPKDNENTYLVWISNDGNSPDGDIRCH